jgi:hypothetical protein
MDEVFWEVASELKTAGGWEPTVEVVSQEDASLFHQIFTFKLTYSANQWIYVTGKACGYDYRLTLPFRNGVTLPYLLEIPLKAAAQVRATLHPWITSRGRWYTEPLNRKIGKALRGLRLPGVGWTHASGGLKHTLEYGGYILPPGDGPETNRWIVSSAYQGFIFVRPRIVKYLTAAERLDRLLQTL